MHWPDGKTWDSPLKSTFYHILQYVHALYYFFSPCKKPPVDMSYSDTPCSSTLDLPEKKYVQESFRTSDTLDVDPIPPDAECTSLRDMCFLATAYASNLGGTGSLTGTGANLLLAGFFRRLSYFRYTITSS